MTNFEQADFFTDLSLVDDPYPYFEFLRSIGPVCRLPHRNVVAVTGYEEALSVYNDRTTYSSCNAVTGPIPDLPFVPMGPDIGNQIDTYRSQMPMGNQIVTFDGDAHSQTRSLLMLLFTPRRLKEIDEALRRLAEQRIDAFMGRGQCELITDYASPYATQVIGSLLGVPEEDSAIFSRRLAAAPAQVGAAADQAGVIPLDFLFSYFMDYVTERRRNPRNDVMSELAAATFRDGSLPSVTEIVSAAEFLFGAGQDTTVRLLSASLRILGEQPDLQDLLRHQPDHIPAFIEETLRISSPVKCNFRLARVATRLGGVDVAPGTTVVIFVGAANRDPRRFERPAEFLIDRPRVREHLAFGRGSHTCAGAALARAEVTVSIDRLLERLGEIRISEEMHGPPAHRRYSYDPTYLLRGLTRLHLKFTPMRR